MATVEATIEVKVRAGLCKNCKHCKQLPNAQPRGKNMPHGGGFSCNQMDGQFGDAVYPDSKAWARDMDCYLAWVAVSPDFGCVMFEQKEAK